MGTTDNGDDIRFQVGMFLDADNSIWDEAAALIIHSPVVDQHKYGLGRQANNR